MGLSSLLLSLTKMGGFLRKQIVYYIISKKYKDGEKQTEK